MKIRKVTNGYIVNYDGSRTEVFQNLEEVFEAMLSSFEGRAECFDGDMYGKVKIIRKKTKQ